MSINTNNSIERKISKAFVHHSPWENILAKKLLSFLDKHTKLFVSIVWAIQNINEKHEMKVFKKIVKPGMTIFDIGANIGLYTTKASKLVGLEGQVHSFEPDQKNYQILQSKTKEQKNLKINNVALSNENGQHDLFIDAINPGNHSFSKENLYKNQVSISVPTTTLDEYVEKNKLEKVDVIKIDVQGAEYLVFSGARKTLSKFPVTIIMEFWPDGIKKVGNNPDDLIKLLHDLGYKFEILKKGYGKKEYIEFNDLIENTKKWSDPTDYVNLLVTKN
jgi:FkbM family methyltransferase